MHSTNRDRINIRPPFSFIIVELSFCRLKKKKKKKGGGEGGGAWGLPWNLLKYVPLILAFSLTVCVFRSQIQTHLYCETLNISASRHSSVSKSEGSSPDLESLRYLTVFRRP